MLLNHRISAIGGDKTREVIKGVSCTRLGSFMQAQLSFSISSMLCKYCIRSRDLGANVVGCKDLSSDALQDCVLQ
jgi:hypothetical protein